MAKWSYGAMILLVSCMVMVMTMSGKAAAAGVVTCSDVKNWLSPCISYVIYGGEVPSDCCVGLKALNEATSSSTQDRRNACQCLIDGVSSIPWVNYDLVSSLPNKCAINFPYQITPSTDCSQLN